jgi:hypothetical protein
MDNNNPSTIESRGYYAFVRLSFSFPMFVFWFELILARTSSSRHDRYFGMHHNARSLSRRRPLKLCTSSDLAVGGYNLNYTNAMITSWGSSVADSMFSRYCVRAYLIVTDSTFANIQFPAYDSNLLSSGGAFHLDAGSSRAFTATFLRSTFRSCSVVQWGGALYAIGAGLILITDCDFDSCVCNAANAFCFGSACVFRDCTNVTVRYTHFVNNTDYSPTGATFDCTTCPYIDMYAISFLNNSFPNVGRYKEQPSAELQLETTLTTDSAFKLESLCFIRPPQQSPSAYLFYIVCRSPPLDNLPFTQWRIDDVYFDKNDATPIKWDGRYIAHMTNIRKGHWNEGCAVLPTSAFSPSKGPPPSRTFTRSVAFGASNRLRATARLGRSTRFVPTVAFTFSLELNDTELEQTVLLQTDNLPETSALWPSDAPFEESLPLNETGAFNETEECNASQDLFPTEFIPSLGAFARVFPFDSSPFPTPTASPRRAERQEPEGDAGPETNKQKVRKNSTAIYVGISLGTAILVMAAIIIFVVLHKAMKRPAFRRPEDDWSVGDWEIA